ncbi:hypothetical protein [Sinomicrobium sp. M5D2P17]
MKDIRELLEKGYRETEGIPEGHEERFLSRLDSELPEKKVRRVYFGKGQVWKIAASFLIFGGIATVLFYSMQQKKTGVENTPVITDTRNPVNDVDRISLGDLSPDLKKVEEYYVAAINWELSQVEIDDGNKRLFDEYMARLGELNEEYQALNRELNDIGPNEQTVVALIDNLKMRLQLLYRLKEKLQELKNRNNEEISYLQV